VQAPEEVKGKGTTEEETGKSNGEAIMCVTLKIADKRQR
jgi:hypothetical protein